MIQIRPSGIMFELRFATVRHAVALDGYEQNPRPDGEIGHMAGKKASG